LLVERDCILWFAFIASEEHELCIKEHIAFSLIHHISFHQDCGELEILMEMFLLVKSDELLDMNLERWTWFGVTEDRTVIHKRFGFEEGVHRGVLGVNAVWGF
jgi:hypothetical protein